jgi:hypothetical protein
VRTELASHINRLERSLEDHEVGPIDILIAEKIEEVKNTSISCRKEEVRLSDALRLGLDTCRDLHEVKAWLKEAAQHTCTADAEEKLVELEVELKDVAQGLRAAVKVSTTKVDAMLGKLRNAASVVGLQSLTTTRCTICYNGQLECFINPCGHTMCRLCASMLTGTCFICKEQYQSVRPLYM